MLLAIDTSTPTASIALYDERGVLGEVTWRTRENHTRSLMPEIVRLMELVGTNASALRAIGVATGPGSFTGLRIGLSVAKGLAFSLNAALIGVPTLDVCASACACASATQNFPACAILLAGRGRFGAALYENENGLAQRVSDYFFGNAEQMVMQLREFFEKYETVFAIGEMDATLRDAMRVEFSERVIFANDALNVRRAGFLSALAWRRWHAGAVDDLQTLAPFYVPTLSVA